MSANIRTNAQGITTIAHTEEIRPWWGTGTVISKAATAQEVLKASNLDWDVIKAPSYRKDPKSGLFTQIPGAFHTYCSDTNETLGPGVGSKYTVLQNRDAFMACDILRQRKLATYLTAGSIGLGERVWIMMAPTQDSEFEIFKGDPIKSKFLFSTTHDGSGSTTGSFPSETVVCSNTLHIALGQAKPMFSLRHTESITEGVKIAIDIMASYVEHLKSWRAAMTFLTKCPITNDLVEAFEREVFGDMDATPEGKSRTILANKLAAFETCLVSGKGSEIPGRNKTMYGVVQAYTEWVDWHSQVKGSGDRTNMIVFGNGAKLKTEALEFALVLARKSK